MDRYTWWAYTLIFGVLATATAFRLRRDPHVQWSTLFGTAAVLLFVIHFDLAIGLAANR